MTKITGKWLRRLSLLALVAIGLWLWKSAWFVQNRDLYWQLGEDRSTVREVEIQIWTTRGELLKRGVFFFADGAPAEIIQQVALKQGVYLTRVFVKRTGYPSGVQYAQTLQIGAEDARVVALQRSN
jgi:hypothetical protein